MTEVPNTSSVNSNDRFRVHKEAALKANTKQAEQQNQQKAQNSQQVNASQQQASTNQQAKTKRQEVEATPKNKPAQELKVSQQKAAEVSNQRIAESVESFRTQMQATAKAVKAKTDVYVSSSNAYASAAKIENSVEEQAKPKEQAAPEVDAEVRKVVEEANRALAERLTGGDSRLVIEPDPSSGSFIYKTVDKEGNVKGQWPRDDFLRKVEYVRDVSGVIADRDI